MHIKVIGGMDMYKKGISIKGNMINNSIGYCHYKEHEGELNKELVKQRQCILKNCIHLEKYSEKAFEQKAKYYNKSGKNKRCRKHRTKP